jgi:hypothetical protein
MGRVTATRCARWSPMVACLLLPAVAWAEQGVVESSPSQPISDTPVPKPVAESPAPEPAPDTKAPISGAETSAPKPPSDATAAEPPVEPPAPKPTSDAAVPEPAPKTPAPKPASDATAPKPPVEPPAPKPAADTPARPSAADGLPGSATNPGLGLSPEAPGAPPAPGGRAPSFGAPVDKDAWVFRWGGRISGWEQVGIGRSPYDAASTSSGTALHTPPFTVGKIPIWAGPGGTLNFQYGNQTILAFAAFESSLTAKEWNGYHRSDLGPRMRSVYLAVTPAPIGDWRLRFQVGAFPASYGAPGQWGWGIYGPVLSIHGYGGTATATYDLNPRMQLYLECGVAAVPEVDEAFVRGTYADWSENGLSTIASHVHAGVSFDNKYFAKLHLSHASGNDMRQWLDSQMPNTSPHDGKIQVAALELRWVNDPFGQLGVTPVYWGFEHSLSVHNGIWWGLDWTAGGREMTRKFLGPQSDGTGKIVAVSAEYDFSLSRILRYPEAFDGNGQDLRVSLAFLPFWTVRSADPNYQGGKGYFLGATLEYVLRSWFSAMVLVFGENREMAMATVAGEWLSGRWSSHSSTVGLVLHSDWQSQDRIVLAYTRYFYSNFADSNPARPLDRNVLTLGASIAF